MSTLPTSSDPSGLAEAITPHDANNLAHGECRGIYVGSGGSVTAVVNNVAILFAAVPTGAVLPVRATRVNATGTTAASLVALF